MRHWWWKAAVAGFAATLIMTFVSMPFAAAGPSATAILWSQLTGVDARSSAAMTGGMFLHFLYGTLMGVLFATLVVLSAVRNRWFLYGLAWGVVLWLTSLVLWTPMIVHVAPLFEGATAALLVGLLLHLIYGGILGGILAWWVGDRETAERRPERAAMRT